MGCCQSVESDSESPVIQRPTTTQWNYIPHQSVSRRHASFGRIPRTSESLVIQSPTRTQSNYIPHQSVSRHASSGRIPRPSHTTVRNPTVSTVKPIINQPLTTKSQCRSTTNDIDIREQLERTAWVLEQRHLEEVQNFHIRNAVNSIKIDPPSPESRSISPLPNLKFHQRLSVSSLPDLNIPKRLAEIGRIDIVLARNIVNLFKDGNTIPFVCRYRQDLIKNITPDKLRKLQNVYTEIIDLRKRSEDTVLELRKVVSINDEIRDQILNVKTKKELEYLYSIYKPATINYESLGLGVNARRILLGESPPLSLHTIVDIQNSNLNTIEKVRSGICQIISDIFSKNSGILQQLHTSQKDHKIVIKSSKQETNIPEVEEKQSRFELYWKYENDIKHIKSHQILAIMRGEKANCLFVEIEVADSFKIAIRKYIYRKYLDNGLVYTLRNEIFELSFEKCYSEKLFPLVCKQVRAYLTKRAETEALEQFAKNLKQLLLTPPLKGERILGIDPGFRNGCKLALISETADLLEQKVIYPHNTGTNPFEWGIKLADMMEKHCCKIIALGDGTACRETEAWLTKLFDAGILDSNNIHYDIVSEQGASVYSCSPVAKEEFPKLDFKIISAISIARRLNDPLSEYVKIEPRHLGIGMYQLDLNENLLSKSLDAVVSECVSYVGVDVNTASLSILKHVAGLNHQLALNIIQYRKKNGPLKTRNELLRVKSMNESVFLQCAGFIRIEPKSVGGKLKNMLDCTWIHPESYSVATDIIKRCHLDISDIGKPEFISRIKSFSERYSVKTLADHFDVPTARLKVVMTALQRELLEDYRAQKKLFKTNIRNIDDLFIGETVTGEVRNVVTYGAFVNIGLGHDALIHNSKMNKTKVKLGDRVTATVIDIDKSRNRISLRLDTII